MSCISVPEPVSLSDFNNFDTSPGTIIYFSTCPGIYSDSSFISFSDISIATVSLVNSAAIPVTGVALKTISAVNSFIQRNTAEISSFLLFGYFYSFYGTPG